MKFKGSVLAAAVTGTLAMGVFGQTGASVYGLSYLDVSGLTVKITPGAGATVNSFTFSATDTAKLNGGLPGINSNTCFGTPGIGAGPVGGGGAAAAPNNCGTGFFGATVLDIAPVNKGTTNPVGRVNNVFTIFGPDPVPNSQVDYSNSDAVIRTSELTFNGSTHTEQITESNLTGGFSANATSVIDSITGFTFHFTTLAPGTLDLAFDATQIMRALFADLGALSANASGSMNATLEIVNDATGDFVRYTPNGSTLTGCITTNVSDFTCTESLDPFSLNTNVGASSQGADQNKNNSGSFAAQIMLLGTGNYTFTLTEKTSTLLTRTAAVPEPGMLALMGIALMGLFATSRRRKLS